MSMAQAQAVSSAPVNGFAPATATLDANAQKAFYEQLLQLRDAVLADRHPRFKLPVDVRHKLQSATAPTSASLADTLQHISGSNNETGDSPHSASRPVYSGYLANGARNANAHDTNKTAHASQVAGQKAPLSGIDPVLLTKSDDLIRAEIHLKRQRIEKQVKEHAEQKKQSTRRDADVETSLKNLPDVLQMAWDIVKPVSGLKPSTNNQTAASDSFDENSYYSSQANDWSSEASVDMRREEHAAVKPSLVKKLALGPASSAFLPKHHQPEHLLDPQAHQARNPVVRSPHNIPSLYANDTEGAYDAEREDSEEYSPPAAEAFSGADGADADAMDLDDDSSEFVPEEPTLPSPQVPIITNHLMHIAAPQPARVSPLAVGKVPGLGQPAGHIAQTYQAAATPKSRAPQISVGGPNDMQESEDSTTSPRNSGPHSPMVHLTKKQKTRQRKRKREAEAAEKTKKKHEINAPAKSPEPYIKPEPVSPPPFANISDLQPAKNRAQYQLPPDVEIVSPHEFRPRPRQPYYHDAPPAQPLRYGSPASPAVIQVASPAGGYRRGKRDDQDLRRVASLHAAQRPMSPGYPPKSPVYSPVAPYRTVSQPFMDQAGHSPGGYRMEAPRAPGQYIRSERSMSPPQLRTVREPYTQRMQSPILMAPPPAPAPRRIVMDQYGNKYVAADETAMLPPPPPPPQRSASRMSVMPQSRHEGEVMYERAPSRSSVMYAPQPGPSVYGDSETSRMPPPPPMTRTTVQPEGETVDYRAYRQREYSRQPTAQYYREEPVYIREGPAPAPVMHRASAYPPEHGAVPSYTRAYSVRPDAEAVRYVSRAPSVMPQPEYVRMTDSNGPAPGIRAVSVAPGPEYGRPAEGRYAYGHPAAYPMAPPPAGRYVEDEMRGSMAPPGRTEIYVDQYGREVRRVPAYQ